jgi:hypothetical protein
MVAANLTAEHAAAGIVVEGTEFGWKIFKTLSRAGRNGVAEVVRVLTPAVSGMDAAIASGPIERRSHGDRRCLDRHICGDRWASYE